MPNRSLLSDRTGQDLPDQDLPDRPPALDHSPWTDLPDRPWAMIPIGSTEQHGPHLPFTTDGLIAASAAGTLAARAGAGRWVTGPVLWYGSSGEHQDFPGTVSMGSKALELVLVELTRSLSTWAGRIVFVNGHGGNGTALGAAVPRMRGEGHNVCWVPCHLPGADAHAGYTETSLLLHLHPELVRTDRLQAGNTTPIEVLMPALVRHGVRPESDNGILGDPRTATAGAGERLFMRLVQDLEVRLRHGTPDARGMLAAPIPAMAAPSP